ncbi:hypothetical protein [Vibrio sp. 99-70-13A1]|uniref:hypothetical protein n=1 Tax=Vibrio sp. 99-70-13A1 TaxID=2607601 RepID=UPI0014935CD6|nr:hypothetical protein [Vibrio sp. 99-70-13A1]NOH97746.1 hypothetical protein [Vibrio sp. 99-70-13A1]
MIKIDYLVQVVSVPHDLIKASRNAKSDLYVTHKLYQFLVQSNLLWRVWYIDEFGKVWLEVNLINDMGEPEFHTVALDTGTYLTINTDSYEVLNELK